MSAAQLDEVRARCTTGGQSAASIARDFDLHPSSLDRYVSEFRAGFIGPLKPCICGRPAGHAGWCVKTIHNAQPLPPEKIASIRSRLLAGDTVAELNRKFGIGNLRYRQLRETLSPVEMAERQRRMWRRIAGARAKGSNITAQRDPLFARILAVMPRSMPPELRDEASAEMYLALLEGELAAHDIEAEARRYRSDAYRDWADRFGGARSMDSALGAEDDRTMHDLLGDDTMMEELEATRLGKRRPH